MIIEFNSSFIRVANQSDCVVRLICDKISDIQMREKMNHNSALGVLRTIPIYYAIKDMKEIQGNKLELSIHNSFPSLEFKYEKKLKTKQEDIKAENKTTEVLEEFSNHIEI